MDYVTMTKKELIKMLEDKERELTINYRGIREKDDTIHAFDTTIKSLESRIKQMEDDAKAIIEHAVQKVRNEYVNVDLSMAAVQQEHARVSRGLLAFSEITDNLIEIKNNQNKTIDALFKVMQNEYLEFDDKGGK